MNLTVKGLFYDWLFGVFLAALILLPPGMLFMQTFAQYLMFLNLLAFAIAQTIICDAQTKVIASRRRRKGK